MSTYEVKHDIETTFFGTSKVHLRFVTAEQYRALESPQASTSHCFPIKDGEVLFTVNPRGVDIIGGHIEKGESGDEALIREALEEACIVPRQYRLIGAIEVDNKDSAEAALARGYPLVGYQLIYAITDFEEQDFVATHECVAREYIKPEDVPARHHHWLKSHQAALDACLVYAHTVDLEASARPVAKSNATPGV